MASNTTIFGASVIVKGCNVVLHVIYHVTRTWWFPERTGNKVQQLCSKQKMFLNSAWILKESLPIAYDFLFYALLKCSAIAKIWPQMNYKTFLTFPQKLRKKLQYSINVNKYRKASSFIHIPCKGTVYGHRQTRLFTYAVLLFYTLHSPVNLLSRTEVVTAALWGKSLQRFCLQ